MEEKKEESLFETEETEEKPVESKPEDNKIVTEAPVKEAEVAPDTGDVADNQKQWYVVNTYSGRERVVAGFLEKRKVSMGLENFIFRIVVAEKTEQCMNKDNKPIVKKDGTIKTKVTNSYPGYIFVEAVMSDYTWYVIRNTQGVTGLVGSSGAGTKPFPIPNEDMYPILKELDLIAPNTSCDYAVGDHVHITSGAFIGSEGVIESVDAENEKARLNIVFFGRLTPVDIEFSSLEKD